MWFTYELSIVLLYIICISNIRLYNIELTTILLFMTLLINIYFVSKITYKLVNNFNNKTSKLLLIKLTMLLIINGLAFNNDYKNILTFTTLVTMFFLLKGFIFKYEYNRQIKYSMQNKANNSIVENEIEVNNEKK